MKPSSGAYMIRGAPRGRVKKCSIWGAKGYASALATANTMARRSTLRRTCSRTPKRSEVSRRGSVAITPQYVLGAATLRASASLKDRCTLGDKGRDALAEIRRMATGGNELGLMFHLGFQRFTRTAIEQRLSTSIGLRWTLRQLHRQALHLGLKLVI